MQYIRGFLFSTLVLLSACDNSPASSNKQSPVSASLRTLLDTYPAEQLLPTVNKEDPHSPLAKLGQELFFSQSLSGNLDVACASCHHPLLAGTDQLSLSVGESAYDPHLIGPGRWHDWRNSKDPKADGGPNVPRHSPTTFNSALYKQALFADGRVFVTQSSDNKQYHRSPDSRFGQDDQNAGSSILATQTRFPVTSNEEMRGFDFAAGKNNQALRQALVNRLRGKTPELKTNNWLQAFQVGFNQPNANSKSLITFENIQIALEAYQRSQLVINNRWYRYVQGDDKALTEQEIRGAVLFFKPQNQKGANCVACHQPPIFSDEKYHNIAMIQFGRGKQAEGQDFGRRGVSQKNSDRYAFRTPSLLNIADTSPYGHTGAYLNLRSIIQHHLTPSRAIETFDFNFTNNPQIQLIPQLYSNAKNLTQGALEAFTTHNATPSPKANLSPQNIDDIIAFLSTLSDPCLNDAQCLSQWLPQPDSNSPDNMRLKPHFSEYSALQPPQPVRPTTNISGNSIAKEPLLNTQPPAIDLRCQNKISAHNKTQTINQSQPFMFTNVTDKVGILASHAIDHSIYNLINMQRLSFSGGAAVGDINNDCYPDLYYVTGSESVDALYLSTQNGQFHNVANQWGINQRELSNGASFVDIDGDGDLDLFTSNLTHPTLPSITHNPVAEGQVSTTTYQNTGQGFTPWPEMSIAATTGTWSFAFGDYDNDQDLDVFSGHWQFLPPNTNHLWENTAQSTLLASDTKAGLDNIRGSKDHIWMGIFADINNDGNSDLLVTADFEDSQIFLNQGQQQFNKTTSLSQLTDQNGMGSAVIDYDNDGDLDWFVTSIWDPRGQAPENSNWGIEGNKLYQNQGGVFTDVSATAGIAEGYWGWGSCFADFNNDQWPDIFHANGFGVSKVIEEHLLNTPLVTAQLFNNIAPFSNNPNQLFISNGDGTFTDQSKLWQVNSTRQGRAVICFDYDRDGDLDIFVTHNQSQPILYQNNARQVSKHHFINIQLQGLGKNTRAIGAKVYVTAGGVRQLQEMRAGGSFIAGGPAELHFGLGKHTLIDSIEIVWPQPNYQKQVLRHIKADQFIKIVQSNRY